MTSNKLRCKRPFNVLFLKDEVAKTASYDHKPDSFVDMLARGLVRLAAAVHPKPVIVRMSDFKTNEYDGLLGGAEF